ncbi:MAG: ABC transporter ATP-binding protein, partial [Phenylobacterium sp.]|nr:ABC transporter ATP-binding protein [Phenylobacterium sp.]
GQPAPAAPTLAPTPPPAPKSAKLSYKEQRRLEELNGLIAELPGKIAVLETQLADPGLYGRDPAAFDRFGQALAAARGRLEAAEMEWLELEERREALEAGR